MATEVHGFGQALVRSLDFKSVDPLALETVLTDSPARLDLEFARRSTESPLIRSGSECTHVVFVQQGTTVSWPSLHSELAGSFLIGVHEFLMDAERWVASYSAATDAVIVRIPTSVMGLVAERIPGVRERMHELATRRLSRFHWTSLGTTGSPRPGVAGALVSRLALKDEDFGENRGQAERHRAAEEDVAFGHRRRAA